MILHLIDYLLLGLNNVLRHKLRSFLTMLGVVLGIMAVLSMMAVGEGARQQILKEMERMGLRNIIVRTRPPKSRPETDDPNQTNYYPAYGLTFKDYKQVLATIKGVRRVHPIHKVHRTSILLGDEVKAEIIGVHPEYFKTFPADVITGRRLTDFDEHNLNTNCIVMLPYPTELFRGRNPIDLQINIYDRLFRIVGVMRPTGLDHAATQTIGAGGIRNTGARFRVFVPYETALAVYGSYGREDGGGTWQGFRIELDEIVLECDDPLKVVRPLRALLKKAHPMGDYEIQVPFELLQQKQRTQDIFNMVMLIVASLTLLVGGVGIINIMLVSVAERTKEIGVRRALGAQRSEIVFQFLVETIALTLTGGVVGCLTGVGAVYVIANATGWPVSIHPFAVVASLLISMAVGVIAGLYPAQKAASVRPVEALRYG